MQLGNSGMCVWQLTILGFALVTKEAVQATDMKVSLLGGTACWRGKEDDFPVWASFFVSSVKPQEDFTQPGVCCVRAKVQDMELEHCIETQHKKLADDTPGLWLGRAPFCTAESADCTALGFQYIRSDKRGDGKRCWIGSKVYCRWTEPATPLIDTPVNHLTVVTYNVNERPYFTHDGQQERTCRIPTSLLYEVPKADVIVFQELFMGGCVPDQLNIRRLLRRQGFPYTTEVLGNLEDREFFTVVNGGIMVASRWPITQESDWLFAAYDETTLDMFADKGAKYVRLRKTVDGRSKDYHVIGVHMQAHRGESRQETRESQISELSSFVNALHVPEEEPLVFTGDFNMDRNDDNEVEQIPFNLVELDAQLPENYYDYPCTFCAENDLVLGHKNAYLDYVMYSKAHEKPVENLMDVVKVRAKQAIKVCVDAPFQPFHVYAHGSLCKTTRKIRDLSDHYAVVGKYVFHV